MTNYPFNLNIIHPSWQDCFPNALLQVDPDYLVTLRITKNWLPGSQKIFNAFSLPLNKVNYILLGESPYPRSESANGYAFWDASIDNLWATSGLNKKVNRATSFRNIIKMLLVAEGVLDSHHTSQENIAKINKETYVQTNSELFANFLQQGFLLLNATLVLTEHSRAKDAKAWMPFLQSLLNSIIKSRPNVKLILFGRIANNVNNLEKLPVTRIYAQHPYNHSFITNKEIRRFFKPLYLLRK